jgi:hypothetical protein
VAPHKRVRAVAEVRGPPRAGIDRRTDLVAGRSRVADRDDHPVGDERPDVRDRLVVLGRERDDPDPAAGRLLPAPVLGDVRRAHVAQRVRATGPVLT